MRCSNASRLARSSPSTAPWRWRWSTAPGAGLALLGTLDQDERMTHRREAVRAHLLEQAGDPSAARESYQRAARMTASVPEQHYLALRAARLAWLGQ